ncbi:flagellar basal body L-ring protein FlgH [Bacteriovoracaceae bacterium]|nr:flagellar basal body L-ring protein FlgH [Bacteriovoracaceae bacterium]
MKHLGSLLILSFIFSSCASYINSIHKEIAKEEGVRVGSRKKKRQVRRRPRVTTKNTKNYIPPGATFHTKSKDLQDNAKSRSLWLTNEHGLLTAYSKSKKKIGDIIILEVDSTLDDKILAELNRVYPKRRSRRKKKKKKKKEEEKPKPAATADANKNKPKDKISTYVVEVVNKDFLLIRGKKGTIHRDRKRYYEVQALVPQRDIYDNSTITSDKAVEVNIMVKRF